MKIKVKKSNLTESLQKVINVVGEGILPVLTHVAFVAKDNKLQLVATDMQRRVSTLVVGAEIEEEGAITLPAKRLAVLVGKYDKDEIVFSTKENNVNICCGRSRQTWNSIPFCEFPQEASCDFLHSYKLKEKQLLDILSKTIFASSKETVQPKLQGVCFSIKEDDFLGVASDGKRLSHVCEKMTEKCPESTVIVPVKTAVEIKRLLGNNDNEVEVKIAEKQIDVVIRGYETVISSKLIEEKYINFEKTVSKTGLFSIDISTKDALACLERVVLALDNVNQAVYLNMTKGKMLFAASSSTVGRNDETIDIIYDGEDFDLSFNPTFMIDFFKVVNADTISMHCTEKGGVVILKDNQNFTYIFMPMRNTN